MATVSEQIQEIYIGLLGRAADKSGLDYWTNEINTNILTLEQLRANIVNEQPEYAAGLGSMTRAQVVNELYNRMFERPAEATGLEYWVNGGGATVNVDQLVLALSAGASASDRLVLDNKTEAAEFYTANITTYTADSATAAVDSVDGTTASVEASKAATTNNSGTSGTTFTLTLDQDTLTGTDNNDTFTADLAQDNAANLVETLQSADALNGGAGVDSLNVTIDTASVAPTLNAVETINLRSVGNGDLSLAGATGVTSVNVANSTAAAEVNNTAGVANFSVTNQKTDVAIQDGTATSVTLALDTVGTVSATAPVEVDVNFDDNAFTSAALTANNSNVQLLSTTAGNNDLTSVSIAATGSNTLKLTSGATSITSLNVTGAGSVDLSGVALTAVTALTAADGGVNADINNAGAAAVTVTTGAGTDTIAAIGAGVKSVSTGAGNDKVTTDTSALDANSTVDLGEGDDSLTVSTAFTAGATLAGGAGTDTIGTAKADYATVSAYSAANLAKVTGFEVLSITDALGNGDNIDVSKISGIGSFTAAAGVTTAEAAAVSNLGAASTVTLAGAAANNGQLTASLKTDTAADSLTLALNKNYADNNDTTATVNAAASTVVIADIESLTVNSTATDTNAPFTPVAGYKADSVNNTLDLTGSNKLTDVTVTGDQMLTLASTAAMTKLATVDASANTGGLSFDGSLADMTTPTTSVAMTITGSATAANTLEGTGHADTITGGAKADTITGGDAGDTLSGNGGNDKFVLAAGDSSIGTGQFDTISDFAANTYGQGTDGAVTTAGATADATKLTGDTIQIAEAGTGAGGIIVDVLGSAADATTFLANNGSANAAAAALDSSTGNLYIDNSGDGVADFFIQLTGTTTIDAAAFVLV